MLKSKSYADVMELVDMQDLGSCASRRVGSSPFIRTIFRKLSKKLKLFLGQVFVIIDYEQFDEYLLNGGYVWIR